MIEFQPHELAVGGGTLAISPMPGRTRHYYTDWLRMEAWRPDAVLSVVPLHELERKGAGSLGTDLAGIGVAWLHFPVPDYGVPGDWQAEDWTEISTKVLTVLSRGGRVLVHCYGGCGRSGMAVLRLMIAAGEVADAALSRLRAVRPCAVETTAQMDWARRG